jgi:transcriptional regulator with XRE-family HTH domain
LVFNLSVKAGGKERYHSECFLNRDESSTIDFNITYCNGFEYSTPEKKAKILEDTIAEEVRIYSELPRSYTKSLQMVIEWRKVSFKELETRTMLNEKTIRRIVNGETQGSINSIILICLGLHLPPDISRHIIDNSPFSLNPSNKSHPWYNFVLTHLYTKSMDEIRSFLQSHGVDPL